MSSPGTTAWRKWAVQIGIGALLALLVVGVLQHAIDVQRAQGIQSGFDFLWDPAGFNLGESWLAYEPSQPFWRAMLAGLANTLRVALPSALIAVVIGTLLGIGRLTPHILVRGICSLWVEGLRNIPLLVHLLLTYFVLTHLLPDAQEPLSPLPGVWLSKSGLSMPWPVWTEHAWWPSRIDWPERNAFNISGGAALTPEYLAVSIALTVYSAAFIAEIVRGGILAIKPGQTWAAQALGLTPFQQLRYIVLPQALRIIVPPLTNQLLNLTKNSSLAVAVGYPDLVSVVNTTLNQTGRSFECIAVLMIIYLGLSLLTAFLMHLFNARVALRGHAA
jgi:general L-amino acid transport system permease protein